MLDVVPVIAAGMFTGTHESARWQIPQSRGSAAVVAVALCGKMFGRWTSFWWHA